MSKVEVRRLTYAEWIEEGKKLFGPLYDDWRFVCPVCGHVAEVRDWRKAGAPSGAIAFSCIGRYGDAKREAFGGEGTGPCDYAGGGVFRLNPVTVVSEDGSEVQVFEFAKSKEDKSDGE